MKQVHTNDMSYYTAHMLIGISVDSSNSTCLDHHDHRSAMSEWGKLATVIKQCHNNYISEGSVQNSNGDNITLIVFHDEMLYKSCIIFHCAVYTSVMVWL